MKLSLGKRLAILREIELGRKHTAKEIAKRHGLHQAHIYKLWRQRERVKKAAERMDTFDREDFRLAR